MIRFERVPEPPDFDENARKPGNAWLQANPESNRPRDYGSPFKPQLADGFRNLCAYSAIFEPIGTVDHYISCRTDRSLAFEWGNYRYSSQWLNSSKRDLDEQVLDPFEVEEGWFEILLPSLQLVATDRIPGEHRPRAEFTLHRLHLRDDERVIRLRREWYRMFQDGELSLGGLRKKAPLIARAVENQEGIE